MLQKKQKELNTTDILNSKNVTRTSWNIVNKELGKDHKNHILQSVNINGMSISKHQIIANAFNKHYTTFADMINQNMNINYCLTKSSFIKQNKLSFSLKYVFQNTFPIIKYHCTPLKKLKI